MATSLYLYELTQYQAPPSKKPKPDPAAIREFRWDHLPYGMWVTESRVLVLFNRHYHPIWECCPGYSPVPADKREWVEGIVETIHFYGHEIRNLLILAATEVEMHWRGILKANGSTASKFNTNEYIKLADPLKLVDYAVTFLDFPDLQSIRPFAGWSKADPTKTLEWYDAYHGVKHNREGEFERGTLRYAFEGVSACIALLVAQFGPAVGLNAELSSFVRLQVPKWPIEEMYLSPGFGDSAGWERIHYPGLCVPAH
jgi:hypothetical protein